jgi:hypothetical protein
MNKVYLKNKKEKKRKMFTINKLTKNKKKPIFFFYFSGIPVEDGTRWPNWVGKASISNLPTSVQSERLWLSCNP